jgi:hypothetical protein
VIGFGVILYSLFFDQSDGYVVRIFVLGAPFALAGVLLLVQAGKSFRGRRRYRATMFEMDAVPGVLGCAISGTVTTGLTTGNTPENGFHVQLSCFRRCYRTGREGNRQTQMDLHLREEKRIRPRSASANEPAQLPVFFALPAEQPASTPALNDNRILWRLDVEADVPGVDYEAQMEVPVFAATKVQNASLRSKASAPLGTFSKSENPYDDHELTESFTEPISRGLSMEQLPSGGQAFYFGPRRHWKLALGFTAWGILGLAALVASIAYAGWQGLPAGGLLLSLAAPGAWGTFRYWTYADLVRIENGRITVRKGSFAHGTPEMFSTTTLADVDVASVGASSGLLAPGKAAYEIRLSRNSPHPRTLAVGWGLKNHAEAEWIAAQMREHAERQARFASP